MVRLLLTALREKFAMTAEAILRMKPYIVRFVEDVTAGKIKLATEEKQAPKKAAQPPADRKREEETAHQTHYEPSSKVSSIGTLVPVNMKDSIAAALKELEESVGPLDDFVATELGYDVSKVGNYFAAEQIDALALNIAAMKGGKGMIIGDQTGVGKGRVVAGTIRWAIRNGKAPVFVTEKPALYKDIYRDLSDIDMSDVNPFMTNAGETIPLTDDGTVELKAKSSKGHKADMQGMIANGSLGDHDIIFTTYAQMQTVKGGQRTVRMDFLESFARGGLVIFDESHNAGGGKTGSERDDNDKLDRATFARAIARSAYAVFYSSATYAKRPEVMDLYFKTDMSLAVADPKDLPAAIKHGGVPLQQVVASMLARAGQYIRRERSFAGVAYDTEPAVVNKVIAEKLATVMRQVALFDDAKIGAIAAIKKNVRAEAKKVTEDGSVGAAGVHSTNFTSIMHNMVDQMLLALKVVPAADLAIEVLKRGEKPVLTVANTMGSFIEHYVEDNGLNNGDEIAISFNDLLLRYLSRSRDILIGDPFGKTTRHTLTDDELGPTTAKLYKDIEKQIKESDFSEIPLSPIDYIKARILKAGYSFGELTGRTDLIDYSTPKPTFRVRHGKEMSTAGRNETIKGFNSGKLDVLLLNQTGSTGLSLHASEKVKDQRKRHMIIVQAEKNIDTHMQMLGRVHRTGQVVLPRYTQLVADIPAEKRPAAVLARKMASLNANTTASRGSAVTAKGVVDFMNDYGDEVVAQVMEDNPDWHKMMGKPLKNSENGDGFEKEGAIRKVTGRIPLMPLARQEELYDLIESEYQALIEEKERLGENSLEAKTLELDAKTEKAILVFEGKGGTSPFAQGAVAEMVDVKRLGKPYTSDEVQEKLTTRLGVRADAEERDFSWVGNKLANEMRDTLGEQFKDFLEAELAEVDPKNQDAQRARLTGALNRLDTVLGFSQIGRMLTLRTRFGDVPAVVIDVEQKGKSKNPAALGSWKFTFAVADAVRHVTLPASRIQVVTSAPADATSLGYVVLDDYVPDESLRDKPPGVVFDEAQSHSREKRTIITGNLLAGFGRFPNGRIINYTNDSGDIKQGILMPAKFDVDKAINEMPVVFPNAELAMGFLDSIGGKGVLSSVEEKVFRVAAVQGEDLYRISVAAAREKGGNIYLNKKVLAAAGRDFVKGGATMRIDVQRATAVKVLQAIMDAGYKVHTEAFRQEAKDYLKSKGAKIDYAADVIDITDRLKDRKRAERFEELRGELEASTGETYSDEAVQEHIDAAGGWEAINFAGLTPPLGWGAVDTASGDSQNPGDEQYPHGPRKNAELERALAGVAADLSAKLGGEFPADALKPVWPKDPGVLRGLPDAILGRGRDIALAQRVAQHFGQEVVFFVNAAPEVANFAGVVTDKAPGKIFVNLKANRPALFVTGHELFHRMEREAPETYRRFVAAVEGLLQHVSSYKHALADPKRIRDEILADFTGASMMKPKFWQELRARERTLFGRIADYVLGFIDQMLVNLRLTTPQTERFLSDVKAARAALVDALTEWRQGKEAPAAATDRLDYAPASRTPRERLARDTTLVDKVLSAPFKAVRWDAGINRAWQTVSALNEKATDASSTYEMVRAGVESNFGLEEAYVDRRVEMQVNLQRWARGAMTMLDKLGRLTRDESRVAYEWMNERDADDLIAALPDASKQTLREIKELVRSLGEEAVRLGQLSQEVFERNELAYLHRSYLKHEIGQTLAQKIGNRKAITVWAEQYRQRGIKDWRTLEQLKEAGFDINPLTMKGQKFVRLELRAAVREDNTGDLAALGGRQRLGKLRKVVYVPAGETIPAEYGTWRNDGEWEVRWSHGGKWGLWRDLTDEEQHALGVIDEVRFAVAKTLHLMTHDIEVGRMQEWVAREYGRASLEAGAREVSAAESLSAAFGRNTWVKVPDAKVKGTNTRKYGTLAGLYVPGPVWNDLRQHVSLENRPGTLRKLWDDMLRMWKVNKTGLSPGVHMNNIMANFFIADFHDLRSKDLLKALRVMLDAKLSKTPDPGNAELYRRFEDSGALHGSFKLHELQREALDPILEEIRREAMNDEHVAMTRIFSMVSWLNAATTAKKFTVDAIVNTYQAEDEVFRLAMFLKGTRNGVSDLEAGKLARHAFLDYDINAPWIQALRRTAFPFIAFPYRAIPMMIDTFTHKPWKLIKYVGIAALLDTFAYAMLGLGGGDEDRERKLLPEEKSGKIWGLFPKLLRMPWQKKSTKRDGTSTDDPVFLDVRRWFPGGDVFDVGGTHAAIPWSPTAMPGGPLALLSELLGNRSQFTGQDLTLATDTAGEMSKKVGLHLYRFWMPNHFMIPGTWSFEGLRGAGAFNWTGIDAISSATGEAASDVFGREMSLPQAFSSALGAKIGSYPEDVAKYNLVRRTNAQINEITANVYKASSDVMRKKMSTEDFRTYVLEQSKKIKELQNKTRDRLSPSQQP